MAVTRRNLGGGERSDELKQPQHLYNSDYYYKGCFSPKAGV